MGTEAVAARLKALRLAKDMNQATWCRLVGISPQAWNNYENAVNRISLEQALLVCVATGVSLDYIYRNILTGLPYEIAVALQQQTGEAMSRKRSA